VVWEDVYLLPAAPDYRGGSLWVTIDALGDPSDPMHGPDRQAFQQEALRKLKTDDYWIDGGEMIIRARDFNHEELLRWVRVWLEQQGLAVSKLVEAPRDIFSGTNEHARAIDRLIGGYAPE
jgi:hypothetical protein